MENWDRSYRLQIGKAGQSGFEIGEAGGPQNMPLHIQFSIEKSDSSTQNTGSLSIWNLSQAHINSLNEDDCVVILKAGYGNSMPIIFSGVVTKVVSEMDDADMKTAVEVTDTRVEIRDTYVSLSYNGEISAKTIMDDTAAQMGVTVSYSYNAEFVNIPNGYSYVGPAANVLTKMCNCCGLSWSIQYGVLQIKKIGDTMLREVYVLSPETGLVGHPKRASVGKDASSKNQTASTASGSEKMNGWQVDFLMNAAINIDDYVYLDSKWAKGYFRVTKIQISGDNFSGDWICTAELMEVSNG